MSRGEKEIPAYRVGRLARVDQQMRALAKRAASLGIKAELIAAFEALDKQLHEVPFAQSPGTAVPGLSRRKSKAELSASAS